LRAPRARQPSTHRARLKQKWVHVCMFPALRAAEREIEFQDSALGVSTMHKVPVFSVESVGKVWTVVQVR